MYKHNGEDIFVIDCHMHHWDARPQNWRTKYGESWIRCFYDFHCSLSPEDEVWDFEKFCRYSEEDVVNDLFLNGYVDIGILNSTYLKEFFKEGSTPMSRITRSKRNTRIALYSPEISIPGRKRRVLMNFARWLKSTRLRGSSSIPRSGEATRGVGA